MFSHHAVAVVGGAGAGIGRSIAEKLASTGHRLVLVERDEQASVNAAADLVAKGADVVTVVADISQAHAASLIVDRAVAEFGRIDVLVSNAGGPPPGRILDIEDTTWLDAAQLLLLGPLRLARTALPHMVKHEFGRLIFMTSTAVRQPQAGLAASTVMRSALTSAAKLLAAEHAHDGVTANCVAPGATATERLTQVLHARAAAAGTTYEEVLAEEMNEVPVGRPAKPFEIAAAVAFLASADSSYVNGSVLTVDGGRTEVP